MMENLPGFLNLLGYIVAGMLFLWFCFFIIMGMAENRQLKSQEKQLKEELEAVKKIGRSGEDVAEFERLHTKVTAQLEAAKQKDLKIEELTGSLSRATENCRRLEAQLDGTLSEKTEFDRLRADVAAQREAAKQKDHEIEELTDLRNSAAENCRRLEAQCSQRDSALMAAKAREKELAEKYRFEMEAHEERYKTSLEEKEQLQDEKKRLEAERESLIADLSAKVNERDQSKGRLRETGEMLEQLKGEIRALETALEKEKNQSEALRAEKERLEDEKQAALKLDAKKTDSLAQLEGVRADLESAKGELGRLSSEINAKIAEVAAKDRELIRLQTERKAGEARMAQAEKIITDYEKYEKTMREQRCDARDIEQRIREMRIKSRVLAEKAKEDVELIAAFAEGKEFDEFRKTVHLDELTQKYEDRIKDIKNKEA